MPSSTPSPSNRLAAALASVFLSVTATAPAHAAVNEGDLVDVSYYFSLDGNAPPYTTFASFSSTVSFSSLEFATLEIPASADPDAGSPAFNLGSLDITAGALIFTPSTDYSPCLGCGIDKVVVSIQGRSAAFEGYVVPSTSAVQAVSWAVDTTAGTLSFSFAQPLDGQAVSFNGTDSLVAEVPEPTTAALLLAGLGTLAAVRRRQATAMPAR